LNSAEDEQMKSRRRGSLDTTVTSAKTKANNLLMLLSDGCIEDINSLLLTTVVTNLCNITGFDIDGNLMEKPEPQSTFQKVLRCVDPYGILGDLGHEYEKDDSVHGQLVKRGRAWGAHLNEPWRILCFAGAYIILSVGFQLTVCSLLGDMVLAIIRANGIYDGGQLLAFQPMSPTLLRSQGLGFSLVGLALQFADALVFVFLGKMMTWVDRWFNGRPIWARMGGRTIVVVDTPCVHQLTENFVSKLYAQGYSFCTPAVHGASGLDHFVHRFTHRVVRGVLIAVGRPDGRLCCLAKSECSILLSAKQAAFIRNPDYPGETSGPEIVTIGHNPFKPNVGLGHHIVLTDSRPNAKAYRRKFVDEYLYERLFLAVKPFAASTLKALAMSRGRAMEQRLLNPLPSTSFKRPLGLSGLGYSQHDLNLEITKSMHNFGSMHGYSAHTYPRGFVLGEDPIVRSPRGIVNASRDGGLIPTVIPQGEPLPFGTHHITRSIQVKDAAGYLTEEAGMLAEFVMNSLPLLKANALKQAADIEGKKETSNDPAVLLAFASKLDSATCAIQDRQVIVQQFYECRIASLERYIGFCVMFHAMAASNRNPWLQVPWDMARSQSNLRVATTGV
jgi:hypothetical protein